MSSTRYDLTAIIFHPKLTGCFSHKVAPIHIQKTARFTTSVKNIVPTFVNVRHGSSLTWFIPDAIGNSTSIVEIEQVLHQKQLDQAQQPNDQVQDPPATLVLNVRHQMASLQILMIAHPSSNAQTTLPF